MRRGKKYREFFTIPNILTMCRIFSIPFIMACFYVKGFWAHAIAVLLFSLACITDFLDGYLARHWKQVSAFGRFLDPIADKLLVSVILLMLSGIGVISGIHLIAACIILAREIIVSGLRQFLSEMRLIIPVTKYAKIKTVLQMIAIFCLLCSALFPRISEIKETGIVFLWLAVVMTVLTGTRYLRFGIIRISTAFSNNSGEF